MKFTTLGAAGTAAQRFLYERLPGRWAQRLLQHPDFEPGIPSKQRLHAALSLETEQLGGTWLRNKSSGRMLLAQTSFLLCASPPSKLAFALSFDDSFNADGDEDMYSLVFHNEFQYVLGCFIHAQNLFLFYSENDLAWAAGFIKAEKLEPIFIYLDQLASSSLLARAVREGPIGHAASLGFNNSFGHAHWNDIIGMQHRAALIASRQLRPLLSSVLVGPQMWMAADRLVALPAIQFASANDCASWCLKERISIHLPIGFRVRETYTEFWQQSIAAQATAGFQSSFSAWCHGRWPLLLVSLRFSEQKRAEWRDRDAQVLALMQAIRAIYPDAAFLIDGLTSRHDQGDISPPAPASSAHELLSAQRHVYWLHGETLANKIFAYRHLNFVIGQFGSGTLLPCYVYGTPSLAISNQQEIIDTYSHESFITNLAKPEAYRKDSFLPMACVESGAHDFQLHLESAAAHILSSLRAVLRDGLSEG